MADGRHHGKISAALWAILVKFGTVTQFEPLDHSDCYKFEISKIQDGGVRRFEKSKNGHISAEIWRFFKMAAAAVVLNFWNFEFLTVRPVSVSNCVIVPNFVCNVRARSQPVEIFGNISTSYGTLAIHRHPRKILRRSSQRNPTFGGFKRKWGSQI